MKQLIKQGLLSLTVVASSAILAAPDSAADYPDKPIKLVVASGAGGSTDTAARIMAINIQEHIGQPIIVVNKKGGSGGIGINFALKEIKHLIKPEDYIILFNNDTKFNTLFIQQLIKESDNGKYIVASYQQSASGEYNGGYFIDFLKCFVKTKKVFLQKNSLP